jgi:hypothetical protein
VALRTGTVETLGDRDESQHASLATSTPAVDATKAVILTATANSELHDNHDTATTVDVITNITYIAAYASTANIATLTTANTAIAALQDFAFSSTEFYYGSTADVLLLPNCIF